MKYSLSQREFPNAESEGTPEGSNYNSQYIPTRVITQLSNSKDYTSSVGFPRRTILKELIHRIALFNSLRYIFQYCPVDKAIQVHLGPLKNSVASLGNTLSWERNTKIGVFRNKIISN